MKLLNKNIVIKQGGEYCPVNQHPLYQPLPQPVNIKTSTVTPIPPISVGGWITQVTSKHI